MRNQSSPKFLFLFLIGKSGTPDTERSAISIKANNVRIAWKLVNRAVASGTSMKLAAKIRLTNVPYSVTRYADGVGLIMLFSKATSMQEINNA
ncbi:hypothetical protein [Pectobacterium aroidearum]|uniref:hypothetical protein n=1 Tax=Pectobacterium aroidearum TaxID=1201031 RepID=UPI00211544FD|nr:hypothetical protein [Pectobacterium aroidearum]UUE58419.1 hypothetical protein L0Y27_03720 [Pectobacterium aroidearum]UUE71136.1 hypothetical protein L0Y21_03785 [Pectobacterium aroidearum]UUE75534.1 hypothetical protein L0Y20_03900 [Pectobacterium aroidearum]UUE79871.1 hypothetical protein L0Y24_03935 [Pectobacterium aroidearum]